MSRYGIALGLLFLMIACSTLCPSTMATPSPTIMATPSPTAVVATPSPIATPSLHCQTTLDEMAGLTQGLRIPDHFLEEDAERTGEEFDVNEYFSVLTHLSAEPGYVLDYVYYYDFMGGEPVIYARQEEDERYATFAEYDEAMGGEAFGESRHEYLDHIEIDGSAEGFFEFVVLVLQGGQFYLHWHANYNDTTVVCSREAVERAIGEANDFGNPFTVEQEEAAMSLNLEPEVVFEEEVVRVRIVTFTKWGGFFEEVFTISRDFPHRILDYEAEELIPYDCGVMF